MKTNTAVAPVVTHEGGVAQRISPYLELRRTMLTLLLFENTFYESGTGIANRVAELVPQCSPEKVADLAIEARNKMHLRHAPLFLVSELSKVKGSGRHVERALVEVIQRADEPGEFLSLYWKYGARSGKPGKHPIAASIKRALAAAMQKFDAYQLAKYNRDGAIKLRDVLFLVHAKPVSEEQAGTWKKLVSGELEPPDTWEVALSAGSDKKETFERLMREGKLGGMATLSNLRNMIQAKVSEDLIRERLASGCGRALPFRFITAAKHAPRLEDAIEESMLKSVETIPAMPGKTGLLVDVSGSMVDPVSAKSQTTRMDAACGLAVLLREKAEALRVATFSNHVIEVPSRRGFALRDAIKSSQAHEGTRLKAAVQECSRQWPDIDRLIVITDEQSQDGNGAGFAPLSYLVNVAPHKTGVSYGNGWKRIDGWSENIFEYMRLAESEPSLLE